MKARGGPRFCYLVSGLTGPPAWHLALTEDPARQQRNHSPPRTEWYVGEKPPCSFAGTSSTHVIREFREGRAIHVGQVTLPSKGATAPKGCIAFHLRPAPCLVCFFQPCLTIDSHCIWVAGQERATSPQELEMDEMRLDTWQESLI